MVFLLAIIQINNFSGSFPSSFHYKSNTMLLYFISLKHRSSLFRVYHVFYFCSYEIVDSAESKFGGIHFKTNCSFENDIRSRIQENLVHCHVKFVS